MGGIFLSPPMARTFIEFVNVSADVNAEESLLSIPYDMHPDVVLKVWSYMKDSEWVRIQPDGGRQ
jgi:hypothetical protein